MDALDVFHPCVREWFGRAFSTPTRAQTLAWPELRSGHSTLVFAPTGSGKTIAAFLVAIERLMFGPAPEAHDGCQVVYVSPMRALGVDVERNLKTPLAGIAEVARAREVPFHLTTVAVRSGDTPQSERARMARHPPDVLITTPESLFLILTSQARSMLRSTQLVIVDEIHALVGTKRGAHLALSLERLDEMTRSPLQRVGLSATQRPLDVVARFLGGGRSYEDRTPDDSWTPRPVRIIDAASRKSLELRVEVPVQDGARPVVPEALGGPSAPRQQPSIWPAIHPRLVELIEAHHSTLLFVNSRRLAERLAAALNEEAGRELARAHHGSIAREQRLEIENALKCGELPALVATSSLELGIDMGAIDLVIQIEAPPSVASGIQRIGRAGHQVEAVSRGIVFPKYRGDLLAAAATTRAMLHGAVETTRVPRNPLDVLAQQLVAVCCVEERSVDELHALVTRAAPYAHLSRAQLEGVLDMLSGHYPSAEFGELRPRLTWNRERDSVCAREGARRLAVTNPGTIPDRGLYGVFLADDAGSRKRVSRRVGELDEEMVFECRVGEIFVLGASSWRIVEISRDRVLVVPASGEPGKMPFWKADRAARPVELGRAIGALTRELLEMPRPGAQQHLIREHALDERAAENLLDYLADQKLATGHLPDDRTVVLERSRDEMGDWRLCLLSPWGGRVHAPLALALAAQLRSVGLGEVQTLWSDDGIVIRLPDREPVPRAEDLFPEPELIRELVTKELGGSALFATYFREAAGRALLLPRRGPGKRTPLWLQRKRSADLLDVASRYASFPIVLETFRECLQDVFDLPGLLEIARGVRAGDIRLVTLDTQTPSPFAASLLFGYVANYLYDGDAPLAERRAQALAVDPAQLRELLGEGELRELLDLAAIEQSARRLQCLEPGRGARRPDGLHDLLLRLGDLTEEEVRARCSSEDGEGCVAAWLTELEEAGRAFRFEIGGESRIAAAEDAGRLRDALGIRLPAGPHDSFLAPVDDALVEIVQRFARRRGPFTLEDLLARYHISPARAVGTLETLRARGRVLEGEFRPGGRGKEWCDADVLAWVRGQSLARLRKEVEPVEPSTLARFSVLWHGIGGHLAGADAVLDVIEQLQGAPLLVSCLERDILPARIRDYRPADLDRLFAAGEIVWTGLAPLGKHDGRVTLFLADQMAALRPTPSSSPTGALHESVREHLRQTSGCFFDELRSALPPCLERSLVDALWDLVWAGEVTNDGWAPVRALLGGRGRHLAEGSGFRSRRRLPATATGRWRLLPGPADESPRERAETGLAIAAQLLRRHGVLTRETLRSEGIEGGFSRVYPALEAMEDAGRARRGYFVAGLGGLQFAHPAAVDQLRGTREDGNCVILAATDPANPYGAALPWPTGGARWARSAGHHTVLVDGLLVADIAHRAQELRVHLPEDEPEHSRAGRAFARALMRWLEDAGDSTLGTGGFEPLNAGPLAPFLEEVGFTRWGPGYRLMPSRPPGARDERVVSES
jgi:ATP-dependent Lhr-like helicase